jgi:hypothetical protein
MPHSVRSAQLDTLDQTIYRHPQEHLTPHLSRSRIELPPNQTREAPSLFERRPPEDDPPIYRRNLPTHLPHPMTLWQAMEYREPSDTTHVINAELRVFPFNFRNQWRENGRRIDPTAVIIRPYREVIELLQFGNNVLLFLAECQTGPAWDHESFPLTYINTMDSLLPLPNILWYSYSQLADLQPHQQKCQKIIIYINMFTYYDLLIILLL